MARHARGSLHLKAIPKGDHTYYHLASSFRDDRGAVRTRYLHHFGPLSAEQGAGLRAWLRQWTSLGPGQVPPPFPPPTAPAFDPAQVEFEDNLPGYRHGIVALGHAGYHRIGIASAFNDAFAKVPGKGRHLKLAEVMVLNRLEDPTSKLRIAKEWYPRTSLPYLLGFPGGNFDEDHLYETLDWVDTRRDALERAVYERVVRPLDEHAADGVLMKDLTSSYFEGSGVANPLSAKGYSRDRVRGSKQVNWSLVLTPKGFPVTLEVYKGNTVDKTTVAGTVERLKTVFGLKAGTFVGDRGMLTSDNLKLLHEAGFHYVVAETLWNEKEVLSEAKKKKREPLRPLTPQGEKGKGQQTRLAVGLPAPVGEELLEESWCEVVGEDGRRHIVLFSEEKKRDELASLKERLEAGREIEKWARKGVKGGEWTEKNHHQLVKAVTKQLVQENADLLYEIQWDMDTVGGLNLIVDAKRKAWEEEKAGWWMLTTDTELKGPEVVKVYKSLAMVERAFRTIKGPISVRPIRHWLPGRIRAHLYLCVVAYLLERWIERKVREGGGGPEWEPLTAEQALEEVREGRIQQVGIVGTSVRKWKVAGFTGTAQLVLDRLGLKAEVMRVPGLMGLA
jgi:transposase